MVKKVQRKFIIVMMLILSFIMLCISGSIIINLTVKENEEVYNNLTNTLKNYRNNPPFQNRPDSIDNLRSFVVELDQNYKITYMKYESNTFSLDDIVSLSNQIINNEEKQAKIDNIAYLKVERDNMIIIAAIDRSIENEIFYQTIISTLMFTIMGLLLLFGIIVILSFWIIKPLKESFDKQKRFISDSSHELKTPLAVINANIDALSNEIGNNSWISNIKSQTQRMSTLVIDMLQLAKLEESEIVVTNQVDLSNIIQNTVLPFEALAFENNKKLIINIEKKITYVGNEDHLKKITNILLDNALKYSSINGKIKVSLKKEKNTPILEVYNTGCTFNDNERSRIFERFYRNDSSRNRETGGSGLGLSIAKTLVDKNKWRIEVESEEKKYTKFIVYFS